MEKLDTTIFYRGYIYVYIYVYIHIYVFLGGKPCCSQPGTEMGIGTISLLVSCLQTQAQDPEKHQSEAAKPPNP